MTSPTAFGPILKWAAITVAALAVVYGLEALYQNGFATGKNACEKAQADTVVKAETQVKATAKKDIARATATGRQAEQSRRAIDTVFAQLAEEAAHENPDPVDSCVLPAERLRRWNAANHGGADSGAAPGQPIDAAAAAAASPVGPDAGPGGQPPGGSQGLPPTGGADVQPVGLPAN